MNVSIGNRWQPVIDALVKDGRFDSASDVIGEGIRLVEERERKLAALRETVEVSIARNEWYSIEEVEARLAEKFAQLRAAAASSVTAAAA